MQRRGKHASTTIEAVFSAWSVLSLYKDSYKYVTQSERKYPCGGGVEYFRRDPASRRRQRKGSLESETVKYGNEYQGARTRVRLRWQGTAAYTKDRPVLSSERASPQKQDRNCQTVIHIWSWVLDWARHQDLLTDWPSVAKWLWLWLWTGYSFKWQWQSSKFWVLVEDSHGKFVMWRLSVQLENLIHM
jgi:hypothetical protein